MSEYHWTKTLHFRVFKIYLCACMHGDRTTPCWSWFFPRWVLAWHQAPFPDEKIHAVIFLVLRALHQKQIQT